MAESSMKNDLKLIKLYEERPLLWDTRLTEYFSAAEKKAMLWREICWARREVGFNTFTFDTLTFGIL
jgi:hypothetical protein